MQVNEGARECGAAPSTYDPILEAIREHEMAARSSNTTQEDYEDIVQPIHTASFEETLIALNEADDPDPRVVWDVACHALENKEPYSCAPENRGKNEYRAIEYHAETTEGDTIINIVSESEQILLDELYAKKLAADEGFGLGR